MALPVPSLLRAVLILLAMAGGTPATWAQPDADQAPARDGPTPAAEPGAEPDAKPADKPAAAKPVAEPVEAPPAEPVPQPEPQPQPAPAKTTPISEAEQDAKIEYEESVLMRVVELTTVIRDLRADIPRLPKETQDAVRSSLRTAAGNRVAALAKLQQLSEGDPSRWRVLRPSVDRALADLESAVARSRSFAAAH